MEGEIKSFQDKQKPKEFVTNKPALQEILKGDPLSKENQSNIDQKGTEPIYGNSNFTGNTMALSSSLLTVTLNVNGLNAPIRRHRVSDWILKKSIYCP